jgi:hypothetical protein
MNSFDLELFWFLPMPNITNENFHKTEERHLIKMENNLKMQIKLRVFVFDVCTKQLRYTSCVYDRNISSSELYFKIQFIPFCYNEQPANCVYREVPILRT